MRPRLLITAATGCFFNIVSSNYAAVLSSPADGQNLTPLTPARSSLLPQLVPGSVVDKVNRKFEAFLDCFTAETKAMPACLNLFFDTTKERTSVSNLEELVKEIEEYSSFLKQKASPESIQEKWKKLSKSIKRVQDQVDDSDSESEEVDVQALLRWWDESTQELKAKIDSLRQDIQHKFQETLDVIIERCQQKLQELGEQQADEQLQRISDSSQKVYERFYVRNKPFQVSNLMPQGLFMSFIELFQIDIPPLEYQDDLSSIDSLISIDDSNMLHLLLKIHAPSSTVDPSSTDIKNLKKTFSPGSSKMNTRRAHEYLKRSLDYWNKLKEAAEGDDIRFLTICFLHKVREEGVSEDDDVGYSQHFRNSVKKSIEVCPDLNTTRQQLLEEMQETIKENLRRYLKEIKAKIASNDKAKKDFKKEIKDCTSISALQEILEQGDFEELNELLKEMGGLQSLQQDLQYLTDHGIQEVVSDLRTSPSKTIRKQRNSRKRDREESILDEEPLKIMLGGVAKEKVEPEPPPYHPHDTFVHETFGQKTMARDFFEKALPENIRVLLDLNDLKSIKTILTGSDLTQKRPNSLFRVKLKDDENYIFLLIKHLSGYQKQALKMIADYVKIVKETYEEELEKELIEQSCSYKPRVITIVLHTGYTNLTAEYLEQFNQYTGQILDFFSFQIAPPIILVDLLDPAVVNRFEDFQTTAKIIRYVRLKESLVESPEEMLSKLDENIHKKYLKTLRSYINRSHPDKGERTRWKLAFRKLWPDVEETEDAYPLESPLVDVGETFSQALESLGPKATVEEMCDAVRQSWFNQNRKRPREEVNPDAVNEGSSEEGDYPAVQQKEPKEKPEVPKGEDLVRNHKYTSRDIARLFKQVPVEATFTLEDQDNPPVENLVFRQGNTYVLPPLIANGGLLIDSIKALFGHSISHTYQPRMILVPYNPGKHWVTLRINIPEEEDVTIEYIDSLMNEDAAIKQSRMEDLIQKLKQQISVFSNRTIRPTVITSRVQYNEIDCGVLTVLNVIDLLNGKSLPTDYHMNPDEIKATKEDHRSTLQQMVEDFEFQE